MSHTTLQAEIRVLREYDDSYSTDANAPSVHTTFNFLVLLLDHAAHCTIPGQADNAGRCSAFLTASMIRAMRVATRSRASSRYHIQLMACTVNFLLPRVESFQPAFACAYTQDTCPRLRVAKPVCHPLRWCFATARLDRHGTY